MALETPISFDGFVQVAGGNICIAPIGKVIAINAMMFSNTKPTAWSIEVYQFISQKTPRLLYKVDLDAGDWINDTHQYQLKDGVTIWAKSNVASVSFIINANEQV